jgi:Leucine-rich repeat (LRR) protein
LHKDVFQPIGSSLIKFKLVDCQIKEFDKDFFNNMRQIRSLEISTGSLSRLDHELFKNLTNLIDLTLGKFSFELIGQNTFTNLKELKRLDLARIKNFDLMKEDSLELESIFGKLSNLECLDLPNFLINEHFVDQLVEIFSNSIKKIGLKLKRKEDSAIVKKLKEKHPTISIDELSNYCY